MSPSSASLVVGLGVLGLFYLNRDKTVRTSPALWIPVIWFWILGSRAVSTWLGGGPPVNARMDGSPLDAMIFGMLLASGLAVLFARRPQLTLSLMAANWPIVLYFAYCLISCVWSPYPDIASKRWIKATGDVVMALVVVTDAHPVAALRRILSRVSFVLLPASTLLIKYYAYLGSMYDPWTGMRTNTGVTTDKNILGVTTYLLTLGAFWQVIRLLRNSETPNRFRQFVAQGVILCFGIWDLFTANSATSESCFILAALVVVLTSLPRARGRSGAVHAIALTLVLALGLIKTTGADAAVFHALGRKENLTGRASDIWPVLFRMAPNAVIGSGFESFWLGSRLQEAWQNLPAGLHIDEAHNGYLEAYLNLGAIGVVLIVLILVQAYRRSCVAFRIDPDAGNLLLAYVLSATMYSYTEAGFRMLDYAWSFLLLTTLAASRISRPTAESTQVNSLESSVTRDVLWGVDTCVPDIRG